MGANCGACAFAHGFFNPCFILFACGLGIYTEGGGYARQHDFCLFRRSLCKLFVRVIVYSSGNGRQHFLCTQVLGEDNEYKAVSFLIGDIEARELVKGSRAGLKYLALLGKSSIYLSPIIAGGDELCLQQGHIANQGMGGKRLLHLG
jgi:uncharacterized membrane protein